MNNVNTYLEKRDFVFTVKIKDIPCAKILESVYNNLGPIESNTDICSYPSLVSGSLWLSTWFACA